LYSQAEGAILEDRDDDGDDQPSLRREFVVELLDELPDVNAVLTERGTDGRGRRGLPGRALQLHDSR
jgi:hypothetical protein